MGCEHDFTERETAVTADGMCPLCMAAELTRLRAVAEAADAYFNQKAWGTVADVRAALRAWKEKR